MLKLQNALAGRIVAMLTEGKAPGLITKLKGDHMIGAKEDDTHDGFAMYRTLLARRATAGKGRRHEDRERTCSTAAHDLLQGVALRLRPSLCVTTCIS